MKASRTSRLKSPHRRKALNDELNEHTQIIRELMTHDITVLEEENQLLRNKCLKVEELEEKVELVLKANQQLFGENQKLANLMDDKISQCQILRGKLSNKRNYDSNSEYEKSRLVLEVDELRHQLDQIEQMKTLTINEIQTKNKIDIQTLISNHQTEMKIYDQELIKIRDKINEKDQIIKNNDQNHHKNITSLQNQINSFKEDRSKLNEENQRMKQIIQKLQEDQNASQQKQKAMKVEIRELKQNCENCKKEEKKLRDQIERQQNEIKKLEKKIESVVEELNEKDESSKKTQNRLKDEINDQQIELKRMTSKNQSLLDEIREKNEIFKKNQKKLRDQIENQEADRKKFENKHEAIVEDLQKELKNLKQKFHQTVEELEIKNKDTHFDHLNQLNQMKDKKNSIIEKMDTKITSLNSELDNYKALFSDSSKENEALKNKISDLTAINDQQFVSLKNKLEYLHNSELSQISAKYNEHQQQSQKQILSLTDLLKSKDMELQLLIEEKLRMKDLFIEEGNQMKNDLMMLQKEYQQAEQKNKKELNKYEDELISNEVKYREYREESEQKYTELSHAKQTIINLKNELKEHDRKLEGRQSDLKEKINNWKESFFNSKAELQKEKEKWEKQKENIFKDKKDGIKKAEDEQKATKKEYEKLERENQSLKEFIGSRDKGIDELLQKVAEIHKKLDERDGMIDKLREQLMEEKKKSNAKLKEQKSNLEKSYQEKLKYQMEDYQTRNTILETNLDIALKELKVKENQLEELLRQYQLLRKEMITICEQEATKKDITLKFPGATADLIASKNMFDVFIKEKVLDVCGDALANKQNQSV